MSDRLIAYSLITRRCRVVLLSVCLLTGSLTLMALVLPAAAAGGDCDEFLKGLTCSRAKLYTNAVRHFNAAIKANPNNLKYHYERGVAYLELKEKEEALP